MESEMGKTADHKVIEAENKWGKAIWKIVIGASLSRPDVITICRTKDEADKLCEELNNDPWFLDRGYTRADRIASFDKYYSK